MTSRSTVALLPFFITASFLAAQQAGADQIQTYVERALPRCPNGNVVIQKAEKPGPQGFTSYKARLTSSAQECGRVTDVLVSPTTKQVLLVHLFPLPNDARRLDLRLGELAQQLLKKPVRLSIATTPLPDGVREVIFIADGKEGPYELRGYIDAAGSVLMIGRRGNLNVDPRKSLLDTLPKGSNKGKSDAPIKIVELSDLQCPTCKQAHDALDEILGKNLNRISYSRIDLPIYDIHDWTLSASLAARAVQRVAPQHYWKFVDYIFQNQSLIKRGVLDTFISDFLESHDIDRQKFDAIYKSPAEKKALLGQVGRLFDLGLLTAPTFLVNGQEIFYGHQGMHLKQYLQSLLNQSK